jgi:predicted O-methyltransferase YrrM
MDREAAASFLCDLYRGILDREPQPPELVNWTNVILAGEPLPHIVRKFVECPEFREKRRVKLAVPPGHFYSPIVDPSTVEGYVNQARNSAPSDIKEIDIDSSAIVNFWSSNIDIVRTCPLLSTSDSTRYKRVRDYPLMDAVTLYTMIACLRPTRIVEIGCGHSTLCILDAIESASPGCNVTCIEPYPERLQHLLTASDMARISLIKSRAQDVELELFKTLEANDILFIDSTHVLKTGSDVHYQLFHILPCLTNGVFVHFHDVVYPFEYPDGFIFQKNYSWNEAYAVRAFLMY